jgi:hypothetical protein
MPLHHLIAPSALDECKPSPFAAARGVVAGRGHGGLDLGAGFLDGDVTLDAASSDPALAGRQRAPEPPAGSPFDGPDVQVAARAHDPDRHEGSEDAVGPARRDGKLLGVADLGEFFARPRGHRCISFLEARRG